MASSSMHADKQLHVCTVSQPWCDYLLNPLYMQNVSLVHNALNEKLSGLLTIRAAP